MEIVQQSEFVDSVSFSLDFKWRNDPGAGFSFDCAEDGIPYLRNPAAAENYRKCVDGSFDVVAHGVSRWESSYRVPAVGKCYCGGLVTLEGFTNTCDSCERDYNSGGQLLAPRSQWGEETGESLSDILRIR